MNVLITGSSGYLGTIHAKHLVSIMELIILDENIGGIFNLAPETYSFIGDIVPDPSKLVTRYGYKFKYTTAEAFSQTINNINGITSASTL
jgi:UDP-glucose 4-epimerase